MSGLLPTGTVTLLLADVEGSTRLWETQPAEMTAAIARLNQAVSDILAAHDGVRPVEQGEGDSFVAAFARASDAVAAALELQRAPLAPIRLRLGIHSGEIQLRDEGNYMGPTINRTARLRDLGHGGQTLLSGAAEQLVVDRLPDDAWVTDLGTHPLRDLPRPEHVVQLCHPDLVNEFPPLRISTSVVSQRLPAQLTSFVGRDAELAEVRKLLADNRLVTLTGAGGVGKTRLAVQIAGQLATEFPGGVWYVDLAPITDPGVVPIAVARALELPDQPGCSTMDTISRFVADRKMLVVLDNCEHLLDASAAVMVALLGVGTALTLLATSREAIGVAGEVGWRVPSLSFGGEATELFSDRARRARPDFVVTEDNAPVVAEICSRLDGLPLAIELAAARVRALSLPEILGSLHDRFRLLTGGARTAVRRQQTLRASVDWSHALLTEPERVLFRRLAAFSGGFDLEGAQAVAGGGDVERYQVLDQLTLLVDKSLLLADDSRDRTRYRLLETVRQYAQEKLGESGEADAVRSRHRDYYTSIAVAVDAPAGRDYEQHVERAELEIDNLRAAFAWSRENSGSERALALASSLQPLWFARGRVLEGLAWFNSVLTDEVAHDDEVPAAVRSRALADKAVLATAFGHPENVDHARQALDLARDIDDAAVLARALTAYGFTAAYRGELPEKYFAEAIELARTSNDKWRLAQMLAWQAHAVLVAGDPVAARVAAEEGRELADALGDRFDSRHSRVALALAQLYASDLDGGLDQLQRVAAEADAAHDGILASGSYAHQASTLAWQGKTDAARIASDKSFECGLEFGPVIAGLCQIALLQTALAAGDAATAQQAAVAAWEYGSQVPGYGVHQRPIIALAALASGDLAAARRWADEAVAVSTEWLLRTYALTTRAGGARAGRAGASRMRRSRCAGLHPRGLPAPGHPRLPRVRGHRGRSQGQPP
ncbi:transcriptional regulator [Mycobacterium montefiorense]|uniref:Transcriptional regulator n=1 Tax=Mycobacterium montefiorense TaxID=154654 RepID=A0AA37UT55_9MYCO|nr:LuxR family transcriptional regulator [Mycobacterium montefiorense]GKU35392.1 transcriptional regulator [Mycobacterium montefiorense]GKU40393.1 transcriptional regulator [Mycobacterium montefiorense]GKU45771.1 transcriptional regulator [Mycobacterium montefiorense]GKU50127.1 transcriptional regulator [Mycobacterium montefiorense]